MALKEELMWFWGYSESQALELIKHYELLGDIADLEAVVSEKNSINDTCSLL